MNSKEVSYLCEIWKDIKDYEDEYEVSNLGRVRNKKTKKILKQHLHKGYSCVILSKNGKHKCYLVHRLVYEAFIGEIPEGMEVNHKDENPQNNILSNIDTLMTHRDNINFGTRNERVGEKNKAIYNERFPNIAQKTLDGNLIKVWPSTMEIERQLGYCNRHIAECCRGGYFSNSRGKWINITQAYGYIWEYTEEKATA